LTRKPKYLLSGLLRCPQCGSGMAVKDHDRGRRRVMCSQFREAGACTNNHPHDLDTIEQAVLAGLRDKLKDKKAIDYYVRVYNAERAALARETIAARTRLEERLEAIEREHKRILTGYTKGFITEAEAGETLPSLRAERDAIKAEIEASEEPPKVVALHPAALTHYMRAIDELDAAIRAGVAAGSEASRRALRDLVERVVVIAAKRNGTVAIDIHGKLAGLIGGNVFPHARIRGGGSVVAEVRQIADPRAEPKFSIRYRAAAGGT
jgi:hypothetical protein